MRFTLSLLLGLLIVLAGCTTRSTLSSQLLPSTKNIKAQNKSSKIETKKDKENIDEIDNFEYEFAEKKDKDIDDLEDEFKDKEKSDELEGEFEDEFEDSDKHVFDPLNKYNKIMTSLNDKIFIYALNPIAEGYSYVIPEVVRESLANFIYNLQFPIRFSNNLLQGKIRNSSDELKRFIVNSTIGLAGLMNPAHSYFNISSHNEDFGQTLGHYGVGSGFHIVLPFLGPSNVRDILGLMADGYISPLLYQKDLRKYKIPENYGQAIGFYGIEVINKTSLHLDAYEILKKDAIDLYPFLRDFYETKRKSDIKK